MLETASRNIGPLKSIWFLIALSLCVPILVSVACKSDYQGSVRQNKPGDSSATRQVKTARVEETPFGETVTANGTLAAFDQSTAGVKVAGRLSSISVDFGSVVRRGQIIAQIEPNDYKLRVQQAEAALSQARARLGLSPDGTDDKVNPEQTGTVRQAKALLDESRLNRERAVRLVEQGVVAKADFDAADASYKVAQSRYQDAIEEIRNRQAMLAQRRSELSLTRQQLADTAVYAPLDGIIQEKRASVGEYLAAGAPVVNIVRMNPLRLRAEVPERDAGTVRFGQNVRVSVEGDAKVYLGQIKRLSPVIAQQNRMLLVEA
ncbi:MAG: HlyD family efflux transporter periplasmic adaptor subunit, partial [Acidobacteriota bacterium]|nr:HlyD family efflux transporter periplasmic adaptor subunit [Acidobacteriota bacterium]